RRSGTTVMNAISVTFAALRVATATTQSSAASCMLLPMLEPIAPTQKTRKSWKESARSDRGSGRVRSGSSAGAWASKAAWVTPGPGLPGRDAGDLDGLGVLPGPEERAGPVARQRSARDDLRPVDEDVLDALGLGGRAGRPTRITPRLAPQPPGLRVVAPRRRHEHRAEIVRDDDVEQCIERVGAAFGRDVGDGAARQALVPGREGLADLEPVPTQHGAEQAGVR